MISNSQSLRGERNNLQDTHSDVTWRYVNSATAIFGMKKTNELPALTGLQFLVIDIIGAKKVRGAEIRDQLKSEHKVSKTGPAFYQLMARLEEAKFVEGWYEQEVIDGQIIKQRHYKVTGLGERARRETLQFYSQFATGRVAYA